MGETQPTSPAAHNRLERRDACLVAVEKCIARDPALRRHYLEAALAEIPRLLGAIDRNPFHATYGCLDRQFWHYRTSDFPSEMYQEGVLPLALVYAHELPGNRWHRVPRVRELCLAALRFSARSSHADGSCDDYYPFERALGAAVFSLVAATETCLLLEVDDREMREALVRRGRWLSEHDETGRLANHQALAALGLWQLAEWTGNSEFRQGAAERLARVLEWQHDEGWFDEYGGADPGYQTVTIDCLAKYRRHSGDAIVDEPLKRAVNFARLFLHPDSSYSGEYGSRGTYHFYPHGFELLTPESVEAAELADGFLDSLQHGRQAYFADDRMYAHRLGNLIHAYRDWSPTRPASSNAQRDSDRPVDRWLPGAGIYVRNDCQATTIISAARGGVLKRIGIAQDSADSRACTTDAGLVVEFSDERIAVSQLHDRGRSIACTPGKSLTVEGPLHWSRHETATPLKFIVFRVLLLSAGRWFRSAARWLLQKRLITGRQACPVRLCRTIEFETSPEGQSRTKVTDHIQLLDPRLQVRRMSFGVDHQSTYVAATGVYQESVLQDWTSLDEHVSQLNATRSVTITREL